MSYTDFLFNRTFVCLIFPTFNCSISFSSVLFYEQGSGEEESSPDHTDEDADIQRIL